MSEREQIQGGADGRGSQPKLSALSASTAVQATGNGSRAAPAKRRRSPIPHRNPTVRRRVREMSGLLGYEPTPGDIYALTRWAHLYEIWRGIGERLDKLGPVKADGAEPRRLLAEFRSMSAELSRLEASLGMTAAARASLGVDITRLRKLTQDDGDGADVTELEGRLLAQLQRKGDGDGD